MQINVCANKTFKNTMGCIQFVDLDLDDHNDVLTGSPSSSMSEMGGEAGKRAVRLIGTDCLSSRLPRGED